MSKITFRADDDLVKQIESLDASKSEVMREALREYLDGSESEGEEPTLDAVVADRVDELVDQRLATDVAPRGDGRDINVNVTLEGAGAGTASAHEEEESSTVKTEEHVRTTPTDAGHAENTCQQCGESLDANHVYCPNCGEKATHRVFCDCGDELRSDWAFCPGCGRRTPSADVLDSS
ncbi:CopG family transcriptional regulator [Haladaptatus sp. R4]|uniref:double zinc ribbon domain-containing protein n=1 Tax=Haladaptatus sp. R4 TaxID=1679489 RepID=UPI0007B46EDE|nr:zinc ribbon domain-containing protein [Haladaptatus sp. R4]KZN24905.1 CopG family transcriptional regulator [Haladaptatus sp. R4]